ncbi:MAG: hypothetical protein AAGK92_08465 [Pseudomonadota bacterium]
MPQTDHETAQAAVQRSTADQVTTWLKTPISITAPGWAFALAAFVALLLLGVALD